MSCRPAHNFNSRPSARGDFPPFCRPSLINYFNSRPSARGDPAFLVVRLLLRHHFNSRPSARGDMEAAELAKMSQYISIHAPPRGATARTSALQARNAISIHAPPRGATLDMGTFTNAVLISIHAPPRGATIKLPFQKFQRGLFQFTPLREGRPIPGRNSAAPIIFQFTPLREGRPPIRAMIVGTLSISIHAPPRGATAGLGLAPLCPWHFNSRPSARGDPSLRPNSATLANYFNSRPSARGDYRRNFRCDAPPLFQFTPLREGRPYARTYNL